MGKTRRKYTREFKLSIIRELESGVSVSEISRKYNVHPALPGRFILNSRKNSNEV